jgi:hypothetical protein
MISHHLAIPIHFLHQDAVSIGWLIGWFISCLITHSYHALETQKNKQLENVMRELMHKQRPDTVEVSDRAAHWHG